VLLGSAMGNTASSGQAPPQVGMVAFRVQGFGSWKQGFRVQG